MDGVYAPDATGSGVNIYIIDTGIYAAHAEFGHGARSRHGYTAIHHGRGSEDCEGHGTHVAGTAGGTTYGVAKNALLWAVRIGDCAGQAPMSGVLDAINWLTPNHQKPAVANLSYSWSVWQSLETAVNSLVNSGVTIVTSAGNLDHDACNYSPNRQWNVLTVAASDHGDVRSFWSSNPWRASNWGSCVKIFGPGTSILSAGIAHATHAVYNSGTSMASPHAAGVAALYLERFPSASPAEVRDALIRSATTNRLSDVRGSPNRLVYAFPKKPLNVYIDGPTYIDVQGTYAYTALASGGESSYSYRWEIRWHDWGSSWTVLGNQQSQNVSVYEGNGNFDLRVTAISGDQTAAGTIFVQNAIGCGPMIIC